MMKEPRENTFSTTNSLPLEPQQHFDWIAQTDSSPGVVLRHFQRQLLRHFQHHVPEGSVVLECGCGSGDLLAGLKPARGVGIDFSAAMVTKAQARHVGSALEFTQSDVHTERFTESFDHIILDYLIGYLP